MRLGEKTEISYDVYIISEALGIEMAWNFSEYLPRSNLGVTMTRQLMHDGLRKPMDSAEAAAIPSDDRVVLPSRAVAEAWGREGFVTEDASGRVSSRRKTIRWRCDMCGASTPCRQIGGDHPCSHAGDPFSNADCRCTQGSAWFRREERTRHAVGVAWRGMDA